MITGDILRPETYAEDLQGCDVIVHLAAAVGRAGETEHFRVNVEGTRILLAAAEAAGVPHFLHVSSITVNFLQKCHSAYARSKEKAEELVRFSSLDWAIVRPTIVLGPRSPWGTRLRMLATLPFPLMFGSGRAHLQPVDVRDVALFLAALLKEPFLGRETMELGGPEVLTFNDLIMRIRGRESVILHVPTGSIIAVLALMEKISPLSLPFTAGQFYGLLYDTVACSHPTVERLLPVRRGLQTMLQDCGGAQKL